MNLSKRLLLLKHLNNFILDQYSLGQSTTDIVRMIKAKSRQHRISESNPLTHGTRKIYLNNYIILLDKRVIDFEYFRKKYEFQKLSDKQIFSLINFRDQIIFKKIFKD